MADVGPDTCTCVQTTASQNQGVIFKSSGLVHVVAMVATDHSWCTCRKYWWYHARLSCYYCVICWKKILGWEQIFYHVINSNYFWYSFLSVQLFGSQRVSILNDVKKKIFEIESNAITDISLLIFIFTGNTAVDTVNRYHDLFNLQWQSYKPQYPLQSTRRIY